MSTKHIKLFSLPPSSPVLDTFDFVIQSTLDVCDLHTNPLGEGSGRSGNQQYLLRRAEESSDFDGDTSIRDKRFEMSCITIMNYDCCLYRYTCSWYY